ncbi:MAG TPA: hypothetical protein VG122_06650 [Gemmata sp.]|jgi:hypothetical protein|nr:hypothetical protein [Gemmata sp.]
MNALPPDEFSEEILAAYADGELDAVDRIRVEQWLADHPEMMDELRVQRELSASNVALWDAVEPPEPNAATWAVVRQEIEAELCPLGSASGDQSRTHRVAGWLLGSLAISGVAAAIGWVAFASTLRQPAIENHQPTELVRKPETGPEVEIAPTPRIVSDSPDLLAAFAVLPMSTDDDVILDRVPGLCDGCLPIGRHPVPGMLMLASVDDVHLEEVNPSPAWPTSGGPKMTTAPGDAPMIFAAKPR